MDGIIETIRHNTTNEDITHVEKHSRTFLFDKTTGKEIANLSGFIPMYCAGTTLLGSANFGYQLVDLATGKVLNAMSEDDIKSRAAAIAGEKIYSVELKKGETSFSIRTMKDKSFVYDPILEKENSRETHTPFYTGYSNEKFKSTKGDLFLAEESAVPGVSVSPNAVTSSSTPKSHEATNYSSLEVGKLADLVVLGRDPFKENPSTLITIPIERTMAGGKWVYES